MRLIDADALAEHIVEEWQQNVYTNEEMVDIRLILKHAPTVDAVPVRHGKWTVTPVYIKCSECGESFMLIPQNYCPHCGAKMDEVEDD